MALELQTVTPKHIQAILKSVRGFLKVPAQRYWIDYDREADVLYLGFRKPQRATDSDLREDGVIVRKSGKRVVGLTILDASRRR